MKCRVQACNTVCMQGRVCNIDYRRGNTRLAGVSIYMNARRLYTYTHTHMNVRRLYIYTHVNVRRLYT